MAKGRLRCIGTSVRLKSRFGAGYVATVHLSGDAATDDVAACSAQAEPVKQFFRNVCCAYAVLKPEETFSL